MVPKRERPRNGSIRRDLYKQANDIQAYIEEKGIQLFAA